MRTITLDVIRHALADNSVKNQILRPLRPEGVYQCEKRREMLGNPSYDFGFFSGRARTLMTLAGIDPNLREENIDIIHSLAPQGDVLEATIRLMDKHGIANIATYSQEEVDVEIFRQNGKMVAEHVIAAVNDVANRKGGPHLNILVAGHGPNINALVWALFGKLWPYNRTESEQLSLDESEAVRFNFTNSRLDSAKVHKEPIDLSAFAETVE